MSPARCFGRSTRGLRQAQVFLVQGCRSRGSANPAAPVFDRRHVPQMLVEALFVDREIVVEGQQHCRDNAVRDVVGVPWHRTLPGNRSFCDSCFPIHDLVINAARQITFRNKIPAARVPPRPGLKTSLGTEAVKTTLPLSVWLRRCGSNPTGGLQRKNTVYGLNGHRAYYIIYLSKVT